MLCTVCNQEIPDGSAFCPRCGASLTDTGSAQIPPAPPQAAVDPDQSPKSQIAALLLCFFFGYLGIHRFYAGKIVSGLIMLLLTGVGFISVFAWMALLFTESYPAIGFSFFLPFLLGGAVSLWIIIDLIMIICGAFKDKEGRHLKNWK